MELQLFLSIKIICMRFAILYIERRVKNSTHIAQMATCSILWMTNFHSYGKILFLHYDYYEECLFLEFLQMLARSVCCVGDCTMDIRHEVYFTQQQKNLLIRYLVTFGCVCILLLK